jgi:hypothetical protein
MRITIKIDHKKIDVYKKTFIRKNTINIGKMLTELALFSRK